MSEIKLTRNLKLSVLFFVVQAILDLFFATFFVSFIMHLSSNQILSVSTYKLFEYIATCVGFFAIAGWCKRRNPKVVFALKQVPQILLLVLILFLQERVVDYIVPLGMLYGVGRAMYFLPMHKIVDNDTNANNLARFTGVKNACVYLVKIVAPVILGFFIDTNSYTEMAYVMFTVTLLECVFIFMLKSPTHHNALPINYGAFLKCVSRFPIMRQFFFMKVLRGFSMGMLGTIITMYTVYMFHTNLNLGIFTTVFAICSVLASWAFGRLGHRRHHVTVMWTCVCMLLLAVSLVVYDTTPLTFLIYSFVYSTAVVLIECISYFSVFALSHSECISKDHKTEFFVLRDFALFIGRWMCLICLMYIGYFGGYSSLRWFLLLITLAIALYGILQIRISHYLRHRVHPDAQ